jgi:putative endonuclease
MGEYYVYILASERRTLYIGMTNNLERRLWEHREGINPDAFTTRHGVYGLVHIEAFQHVLDAIAREKQLKGWRRSKKIALIEQVNPAWQDLCRDW